MTQPRLIELPAHTRRGRRRGVVPFDETVSTRPDPWGDDGRTMPLGMFPGKADLHAWLRARRDRGEQEPAWQIAHGVTERNRP